MHGDIWRCLESREIDWYILSNCGNFHSRVYSWWVRAPPSSWDATTRDCSAVFPRQLGCWLETWESAHIVRFGYLWIESVRPLDYTGPEVRPLLFWPSHRLLSLASRCVWTLFARAGRATVCRHTHSHAQRHFRPHRCGHCRDWWFWGGTAEWEEGYLIPSFLAEAFGRQQQVKLLLLVHPTTAFISKIIFNSPSWHS